MDRGQWHNAEHKAPFWHVYPLQERQKEIKHISGTEGGRTSSNIPAEVSRFMVLILSLTKVKKENRKDVRSLVKQSITCWTKAESELTHTHKQKVYITLTLHSSRAHSPSRSCKQAFSRPYSLNISLSSSAMPPAVPLQLTHTHTQHPSASALQTLHLACHEPYLCSTHTNVKIVKCLKKSKEKKKQGHAFHAAPGQRARPEMQTLRRLAGSSTPRPVWTSKHKSRSATKGDFYKKRKADIAGIKSLVGWKGCFWKNPSCGKLAHQLLLSRGCEKKREKPSLPPSKTHYR